MKSLVEFIQEQLEHVICQDAAGNWRIKGHPGKGSNTDKLGYWKAKYKSKKDAEAALRGYFANKNEGWLDIDDDVITEGVKAENGEPWIVYVDGKEDSHFTEWSKKWKQAPKVGKGWYAGGTVFKIVKVEDNKVYTEEDTTCHP